MSSLSQAGKSILANTNEVNRAFTKGLSGVDPNELQRRQIQKRIYQQQLRQQAQDQKKRKAAEKERQKFQDEKLQRRIEMDIQREKQEKDKTNKQQKNSNPFGSNTNNDTTTNNKQNTQNSRIQQSPTNQRKNLFNSSNQNPITSKNTYSSPQISQYKYSNQPTEGYSGYSINPPTNQLPYSYAPHNIYNTEEDKYYQEEMENRARRFKETLDRKLEEVYKQFEVSKKSYNNDNVIDEIRRRLKSNSYSSNNNDSFNGQKSGVKQFEDEFSMFYKIPKRSGDSSSSKNNQTMKNLDYDSESRYKSSLKNYNYIDESRQLPQDNSRMYTQRPDKTEYNQVSKKWGNKRKDNFLGNRQALDYKIQSALSNIDNIIENHNMQGGNHF